LRFLVSFLSSSRIVPPLQLGCFLPYPLPFITHQSYVIEAISSLVAGLWTQGEQKAKFGYDFWYQPHWDVMVSSEWGAPKSFKKGFALPDTQDKGTPRRS
jgi:hypothetical protein